MRYAIYFTLPEDTALAEAANRWIGRPPGDRSALPAVAGYDVGRRRVLTDSARRYGFHATLKAPFQLVAGEDESRLLAAFEQFCKATPAAGPLPLQMSQIGPFFALTPVSNSEPLQALADAIVREFEAFRAPLTAADMERRRPERLSPEERRNLERWGYPYVFGEFRFHMTLSEPVTGADVAPVREALDRHLGGLLVEPVEIDALSLCVEPEPGADFEVMKRMALRAMAPAGMV